MRDVDDDEDSHSRAPFFFTVFRVFLFLVAGIALVLQTLLLLAVYFHHDDLVPVMAQDAPWPLVHSLPRSTHFVKICRLLSWTQNPLEEDEAEYPSAPPAKVVRPLTIAFDDMLKTVDAWLNFWSEADQLDHFTDETSPQVGMVPPGEDFVLSGSFANLRLVNYTTAVLTSAKAFSGSLSYALYSYYQQLAPLLDSALAGLLQEHRNLGIILAPVKPPLLLTKIRRAAKKYTSYILTGNLPTMTQNITNINKISDHSNVTVEWNLVSQTWVTNAAEWISSRTSPAGTAIAYKQQHEEIEFWRIRVLLSTPCKNGTYVLDFPLNGTARVSAIAIGANGVLYSRVGDTQVFRRSISLDKMCEEGHFTEEETEFPDITFEPSGELTLSLSIVDDEHIGAIKLKWISDQSIPKWYLTLYTIKSGSASVIIGFECELPNGKEWWAHMLPLASFRRLAEAAAITRDLPSLESSTFLSGGRIRFLITLNSGSSYIAQIICSDDECSGDYFALGFGPSEANSDDYDIYGNLEQNRASVEDSEFFPIVIRGKHHTAAFSERSNSPKSAKLMFLTIPKSLSRSRVLAATSVPTEALIDRLKHNLGLSNMQLVKEVIQPDKYGYLLLLWDDATLSLLQTPLAITSWSGRWWSSLFSFWRHCPYDLKLVAAQLMISLLIVIADRWVLSYF